MPKPSSDSCNNEYLLQATGMKIAQCCKPASPETNLPFDCD